MGTVEQLCTFYVAGQLFGVEVAQVQEVMRDYATTRIPLAPAPVAGLINLRGQIVPIVELRRCLSLPARGPDTSAENIVLSTDAGAVSLRVDAVDDVITVSSDAFEAPPDNVRGLTRRLVRGVYKLERGLLLVLSTQVVLELAVSDDPVGDELPVGGAFNA